MQVYERRNNVLQQLLCVLDNGSYSPEEKASRLLLLQRQCENLLTAEFEKKIGADMCVSLCNFANLQFPRSQKPRYSNQHPVR